MENRILLVPVMLLFAAGVVSAAGFEYDETPMLMAAYENAKCKVDFTNDLIDSMVEEDPDETGLLDQQDILDSDLEQLYRYAQSGDRAGFREYMRGTFEQNFRETNQEMREARNRMREGGAQGDGRMLRLRNEYQVLNGTYAQCQYNTMKTMAEERHRWMNQVMEYWKNRSADLSRKGVDATELEAVIDDAEETVVEPYANQIRNAGDDRQMRTAMGSYCLGNGCANGLNHHFYAKAEIAKLNGILGYLEEDAENAGLGGQVGEAKGYLDSADEGVQKTGQNQYGQDVSDSVWENIRNAADAIRSVFRELRGV